MTYWVIEADATTLDVMVDGDPDEGITLTIDGPLTAVTLRPDGVGQRTLPELRFDHLRFGDAQGVIARLCSWARDRDEVTVSLGCVIDGCGTVDVATLSGLIADHRGSDIVLGDVGLISR